MPHAYCLTPVFPGEVTERLKVHDWKSCVPLKRVPGVRIPPSPPASLFVIVVRVRGEHELRDTSTVARFGCRLLIVGSCARRSRKPRQVRKEAAVADLPLCHRGAWLSAMGIQLRYAQHLRLQISDFRFAI